MRGRGWGRGTLLRGAQEPYDRAFRDLLVRVGGEGASGGQGAGQRSGLGLPYPASWAAGAPCQAAEALVLPRSLLGTVWRGPPQARYPATALSMLPYPTAGPAPSVSGPVLERRRPLLPCTPAAHERVCALQQLACAPTCEAIARRQRARASADSSGRPPALAPRSLSGRIGVGQGLPRSGCTPPITLSARNVLWQGLSRGASNPLHPCHPLRVHCLPGGGSRVRAGAARAFLPCCTQTLPCTNTCVFVVAGLVVCLALALPGSAPSS